MKKSLAALLSVALLAGCSNGGGTTTPTASTETTGGTEGTATTYENDYNFVYTAEMTTLDYLYNNKSTNGDKLNNLVEGLIGQDPYGKLVPAMAESWESNEDATVWTFHIRQGAKWVTNNQEEYADVTANDFVTGLQHAADFESETLWLVGDLIVGLNDYASGAGTWDQVGVKALDDYTLEYTLTTSASYFPSMTTYTILYPVNQEFLESQGAGCKLGAPNAEDCTFGILDPTAILYNSAFVLSNYTAKSVIEFTRNETYWDIANVHVPHAKLIYDDGSDPDSVFKLFENGEVSEAGVSQANPATVERAQSEYPDNIYISDTTASTFWATFNFNRSAYASYTDPSKGVSPKTDEQKADTKTAILNKAFRLGVFAAFSDAAYGAQNKGEELALGAARNTLTAPTFVQTTDGLYGDLVAKKLAALDPDNFSGIDMTDGQDAYYDVEKAVRLMQQAQEELGDSVSWPIYLDVAVDEVSDLQTRRAQAIKDAMETAIGDYVQINLVMMDEDNYYNSFYYISSGDQANFDLCFSGGWGPDYADPRSYLNIFLPDTGDMLNMSGLSLTSLNIPGEVEVKEQIGLTEFGALCATADAITDDNNARFDAFADAEAYLIAQGIIRPFITSGANYRVSKVVPYTQAFGLYGAASFNESPVMKYMQVSDTPITTAEHDAAKAEWQAEMAK